MTSGGPQRSAQGSVHRVEQEVDFVRSRLRHIGNRAGRVFVGQAKVDPAQLLGHREHEAVEFAGYRNGQCRSRIAEGGGVEDEMGAAAGPQPQRRVDVGRPHPCRVDDGTRADVEGSAGALVGQPHRGAGGLRCGHIGENPGPVLCRGPRDRGDQSGVVDELPVVGQQTAVEPVAPHGRRQVDNTLGRHSARARQHGSRRARQPAQHVTGQKPGAHQRPLGTPHRRQQRHQLGHRPNQVGCVARHQDSAFDCAAAGDTDIAARQVAQATVHQLGTPPTGAERQIMLFYQRHPQPPAPRRPGRCRRR
ncbi:hypothetical protein MHEC_19140 [Mycobacterium heckeshornense]|uniref:Uncharacterized protein n=1 Tax=Mycobacterium heckeshornense TaxID=110505 RepID=A0A7R7JH44_9MYCO|nr:hypothetical protein MHEC_19140 [Mycobacterium heckeshornense]